MNSPTLNSLPVPGKESCQCHGFARRSRCILASSAIGDAATSACRLDHRYVTDLPTGGSGRSSRTLRAQNSTPTFILVRQAIRQNRKVRAESNVRSNAIGSTATLWNSRSAPSVVMLRTTQAQPGDLPGITLAGAKTRVRGSRRRSSILELCARCISK